MTDTPTLWRSLGQINSQDSGPTGNSQFDPVVVGLAGGGFLVAYGDNSNSADSSANDDIVGRLYNARGNPQGQSFQLNTERTADFERNPEVAALNGGGFALVYTSASFTGNAIVWQTHDAQGNVIDSGIVQESSSDPLLEPRLTVLPDDSLVVTYEREIGGNDNVRATIISPSGVMGPEINVRSHPDDPREPDIATLSTGGFVVAFIEDDPAGARPEFRIYDDQGSFVVGGNVTAPGTDNRDVRVATMLGDRFLITWFDNTDPANGQIYGRIIDNAGNPISGLISFAVNADDDSEPRPLILPDGSIVMIYDEDTPGQDGPQGQRFDSVGSPFGNVFDPGGIGSSFNRPEVALLEDGRFAVVWAAFPPGVGAGSNIQASIWDPRETEISGNSGDNGLTGRVQEPSTLRGRSGNDYLYGGNVDDTLFGADGEDYMFGGAGDDELRGGSGFDGLFGGTGNDQLRGGSNSDILFGNLGNDTLFGALDLDYLYGGDGNDSLFGGSRIDTLYGGSGIDFLRGGTGRDTLFGGQAQDNFTLLPGDAANGEVIDGGSDFDNLLLFDGASLVSGVTLISIERVNFYGTSGTESLFGTEERDYMFGAEGNDDLRGGSENDRLYGGLGRDALRGQSGDDRVTGNGGNDSLFGDQGQDLIFGSSGNDRLAGGIGDDHLYGGSGRDRVNGASGADTLEGGSGNDTFIVNNSLDRLIEGNGEGAEDVARINATQFNITDNAQVERANLNPAAGAGTVTGNTFDNTLVGNSFANVFFGGPGNDIVNGGSGGDQLFGDAGNDTYVVDTTSDFIADPQGFGIDLVRALIDYSLPFGLENLRLQAGSGPIDGDGNRLDNVLQGNTSSNRLNGGSGSDEISGRAGNDILNGGSGNDSLTGGSGANTLFGANGNDTLDLGNRDRATGGSGNDRFRFDGDEDGQAPGSGGPLILDFQGLLLNTANDRDRLLFGTGLESGAFAYIGAQAFAGNGDSQARHAGSGQIEVDTDGDGSLDIAFRLNGMSQAGQLTAADFLWI